MENEEHIQERLAFLKGRQSSIGASDIAAVLGMSRYRGPHDVYRSKIRPVSRKDVMNTARQEYGIQMEAGLAKLYSLEYGVALENPGKLTHPEFPFFSCTPDRLVARQRKGVEIKTASWNVRNDWVVGDENEVKVPTEYYLQCQWCMAIMDYPKWDLYVSIAGDPPLTFPQERDDELVADMMGAAKTFWEDHVVKRVPPPIDGTSACNDHLQEKYYGEREDTIYLTPDDPMLAIFAEYREILAREKMLKEQKQLVVNQLIDTLGESTKLSSPIGTMTYRRGRPRTKTDWEAIACDLRKRLGMTEEQWHEFRLTFTEVIPSKRVARPSFRRQ